MGRYIWMAITKDELELPVAIADTARELAEICGTSEENVRCIASRGERGIYKKPGYLRIKEED